MDIDKILVNGKVPPSPFSCEFVSFQNNKLIVLGTHNDLIDWVSIPVGTKCIIIHKVNMIRWILILFKRCLSSYKLVFHIHRCLGASCSELFNLMRHSNSNYPYHVIDAYNHSRNYSGEILIKRLYDFALYSEYCYFITLVDVKDIPLDTNKSIDDDKLLPFNNVKIGTNHLEPGVNLFE
nr:hypothetical protein [Abalone asfa-like virus]